MNHNTSQADAKQSKIRQWYLARLRKNALALAGNRSWTPGGLITADKELLEHFINSRINDRSEISDEQETTPLTIDAVAVCAIMLGLLLIAFLSIRLVSSNSTIETAGVITGLGLYCVLFIGYCRRKQELNGLYQKYLFPSDDSPHSTFTSPRRADLLRSALAKIERLEERQNLIADFSPEVTCLINKDLNFECVSPGSRASWGVSPIELTGRPLRTMIHLDDIAKLEQAFSDARTKSSAQCIARLANSTKTGQLHTHWNIDWSNSEPAFFCVVTDVTTQQELERLKAEFVAVISHDLRSPLSSVKWTIESVSKGAYGSLSEIGRQRLLRSVQVLDYVFDLIADLIEMHRIESDEMRLKLVETEVPGFIEDCIEAVEALTQAKNIEVQREIRVETMRVDPAALKRVLINLIANAIKFCPEKAKINVNANEDEHSYQISIRDNGPGIQDQYKNSLFERFANIGCEAARKEGSGLGLYIAHSIVSAHGGTIEVETAPGAGTEFIIRLPKDQ